MKKALSLLLCLILILGCLPLTAMADDTELGDGGETGISLTTAVPQLTHIQVMTTKQQYYVGEEFDPTTITVIAFYNYADYSSKDVTELAIIGYESFDSSKVGTTSIGVDYTDEWGSNSYTQFDLEIVPVPSGTYKISVSANDTAGGTVSGGGYYEENTPATVTATANSGYSFVKWTENGTEVSTDASYSFTVTGARSLVAVFEQTYYTATFVPGDGSGSSFNVSSENIISYDDMKAGNYKEEEGCFFYGAGGDINYKLPTKCTFTAPSDDKEFDTWKINDSTYDPGAEVPLMRMFENSKDVTITAMWRNVAALPSVELSIPATINVKYGTTRTPFELQVKSVSFTQGATDVRIALYDSEFIREYNDANIPFTVNGEGSTPDGRFTGDGGNGYMFNVNSNTDLPRTFQAYIDITSDAWEKAWAGKYTATLKIGVNIR